MRLSERLGIMPAGWGLFCRGGEVCGAVVVANRERIKENWTGAAVRWDHDVSYRRT